MSAMRPAPGIIPAALLGAAASCSGIALTATSGWLIVAASFRPQILTLLAVIVLVRAFGVARPALRYVERLRSHDAALRLLARSRASTYAALIPLTPARLGRRSRGELLAGVVDDLDDEAYAQVRVIVPVVSAAVAGLVCVAGAALVSWTASGVLLLQLLACGALWWIGLRAERAVQERVVTARAAVAAVCEMLTSSASELRAIGAEADGQRRLALAQARLDHALRAQGRMRGMTVGAVPLVTAGTTWAIAGALSTPVDAGLPTPVAALILLLPVALAEVVGALPDAAGAQARAERAADRVQALLGQQPAVADPGVISAVPTSDGTSDETSEIDDTTRPATTGVSLVTEGLTATWDPAREGAGQGHRPALPATDLQVAPGERLAIIGPNGCGKSTLLAVLARHLDPSGGSYRFAGHDVRRVPLADVRSRIAIVDDEPHIFANTLRENLRFAAVKPSVDSSGEPPAESGHVPEVGPSGQMAAVLADDALLAALDTAGLTPWYEGLPDGLDTPLGVDGRGVSGGERARLAIARAVLSARPVVLLDEPVAHLDRPTATAVLERLNELPEHVTTVTVSHRDDAMGLPDRVVRLDRP